MWASGNRTRITGEKKAVVFPYTTTQVPGFSPGESFVSQTLTRGLNPTCLLKHGI